MLQAIDHNKVGLIACCIVPRVVSNLFWFVLNRINSENQGSGQQCCYNTSGRLIVGPPGGGTVDLYSPSSDFLQHQLQDVLPFFYCCVGPFPNCDAYYQKRPSSDGTGYQLPVPGTSY